MNALTVNGDTFDFYRESFPWGRTPAYRTADDALIRVH